LLEIAVGDVPVEVVKGYEALLYVVREGGTPKNGRMAFSKEYSSHANLG
jgi:hypothetical protein